MNTKENIEKQLQNLKSHYKVPDNYWNDFKTPDFDTQTKPFKIFENRRIWYVAASILLLVGLGYQMLHGLKSNKFNQNLPQSQISDTNHLFDDLTDEDIIDYLTDEEIPDQEFNL